MEGYALVAGQTVGRRGRVDTGQEQGFGSVDVAEARHDGLVEQDVLDRPRTMVQCFRKPAGGEFRRERFGTEPGQVGRQRHRAGAPEQVDHAKPPRIVEPQVHPAVEAANQVIMRIDRLAGRADAEVPGHAQVDDQQPGRTQIEQQILGPPPHLPDGPANHDRRCVRRERPPQAGPPRFERPETTAFQPGAQGPGQRFDLGKFRYGQPPRLRSPARSMLPRFPKHVSGKMRV